MGQADSQRPMCTWTGPTGPIGRTPAQDDRCYVCFADDPPGGMRGCQTCGHKACVNPCFEKAVDVRDGLCPTCNIPIRPRQWYSIALCLRDRSFVDMLEDVPAALTWLAFKEIAAYRFHQEGQGIMFGPFHIKTDILRPESDEQTLWQLLGHVDTMDLWLEVMTFQAFAFVIKVFSNMNQHTLLITESPNPRSVRLAPQTTPTMLCSMLPKRRLMLGLHCRYDFRYSSSHSCFYITSLPLSLTGRLRRHRFRSRQ